MRNFTVPKNPPTKEAPVPPHTISSVNKPNCCANEDSYSFPPVISSVATNYYVHHHLGLMQESDTTFTISNQSLHFNNQLTCLPHNMSLDMIVRQGNVPEEVTLQLVHDALEFKTIPCLGMNNSLTPCIYPVRLPMTTNTTNNAVRNNSFWSLLSTRLSRCCAI
jgi:hypothetical protein